MPKNSPWQRWISVAAQVVAAVILLQTLFFKFTGAEESVYIFSRLGMEPAGRLGTGVAELIAAALLLVPGLASLGALLTMGLMSGAIFFHLTWLGVEVQGDGGQLFALALTAFAASAVVLYFRRRQLLELARGVLRHAPRLSPGR